MAAREGQVEWGVRESQHSPAPGKDLVLSPQQAFRRRHQDLPVPAAGHHAGRRGHRGAAGFHTRNLKHLLSALSMLIWKKQTEVCELMVFSRNRCVKRYKISFLRWTGFIQKIGKRKEPFQGQQYPTCKLLFAFHRFLLFENLISLKNI